MAYRFKLDESFEEGFLRIGLEQIDKARRRLAGNDDRSGAIHRARKSFKRLRSLLKLCRSAIPRGAYNKHNRHIRDIARQLAPSRDALVMLDTITHLEAQQYDSKEESGALATVHLLLACNQLENPVCADREAISKAIDALDEERAEFAKLVFVKHGIEHIGEGMRRSYKNGRKAFREVLANPIIDAEHEWRKDVQQHWRHMQLLSNAWPDVCAARIELARELSQLLGQDHDLELLVRFAVAQPNSTLSQAQKDILCRIAGDRQNNLRALAFVRGELLFADKPSDLCARLTHYWQVQHHGAEEAGPTEKANEHSPSSSKHHP